MSGTDLGRAGNPFLEDASGPTWGTARISRRSNSRLTTPGCPLIFGGLTSIPRPRAHRRVPTLAMGWRPARSWMVGSDRRIVIGPGEGARQTRARRAGSWDTMTFDGVASTF